MLHVPRLDLSTMVSELPPNDEQDLKDEVVEEVHTNGIYVAAQEEIAKGGSRSFEEAFENARRAAIVAADIAAAKAAAAMAEFESKEQREELRCVCEKLDVSDIVTSDCSLAEENRIAGTFNVKQRMEELQAWTNTGLDRLDISMKQVVAEVAQERKLRESAIDSLNKKLNAMLGVIDPTLGAATPAAGSGRSWQSSYLSENQDLKFSSEASLTRAAPTASSSDLSAVEATLRGLSCDEQIIALGKEMAQRLDKVELDTVRRVDELGAAIFAGSKRLDEHGARLDNQCESLTLQAECVSAAIDRILQWIGEGETSGFAAVVEKLASLGERLNDTDTKPEATGRSSQASRDSTRSVNAFGVPRIWKALSSSNSNTPLISRAPQISIPRAALASSVHGGVQQNGRPATLSSSSAAQQRSKSSSPSPSRTTFGSPKVVTPANVYRREASVREASAPSRKIAKSPTRSPECGSEIRESSRRRVARSRSLTPINLRKSQNFITSSQLPLSPERDLIASPVHLTSSSRASSRTRCPRSQSPVAKEIAGTVANDVSRGMLPIRRHILSPTAFADSSSGIAVQASTTLLASKSDARSVSPQQTLTTDLASATVTARERPRPFRRLISHSIGIGSGL